MKARIILKDMAVVIFLDQYLHEDDRALPRPVAVSLAISCTYAFACTQMHNVNIGDGILSVMPHIG
jgi:hypothetical protein